MRSKAARWKPSVRPGESHELETALGERCEREGKSELFEALRPTLSSDATGDAAPYRDVADRLGMTEGAIKVAAHRMRKDYRELLRGGIAETVNRPEDVDDEIRDLFAALGQS